MPKLPGHKKKYQKLSRREQKLASKYIAEEMREKKYSQKQAKAIGINRARQKLAEIRKRHKIK